MGSALSLCFYGAGLAQTWTFASGRCGPRPCLSRSQQAGPADSPGSVPTSVLSLEALSKDGACRYGDTDEGSENSHGYAACPRRTNGPGHQRTPPPAHVCRDRDSGIVTLHCRLAPEGQSLPARCCHWVSHRCPCVEILGSNSSPFHPKSFSFASLFWTKATQLSSQPFFQSLECPPAFSQRGLWTVTPVPSQWLPASATAARPACSDPEQSGSRGGLSVAGTPSLASGASPPVSLAGRGHGLEPSAVCEAWGSLLGTHRWPGDERAVGRWTDADSV